MLLLFHLNGQLNLMHLLHFILFSCNAIYVKLVIFDTPFTSWWFDIRILFCVYIETGWLYCYSDNVTMVWWNWLETDLSLLYLPSVPLTILPPVKFSINWNRIKINIIIDNEKSIWKKKMIYGTHIFVHYLIFWIVILDDLNSFSNIKTELIRIFFNIFVCSLHSV